MVVVVVVFVFLFAIELKNSVISNFLAYTLIPRSRYLREDTLVRYPILINKIDFPKVSAKSLLVTDIKNNKILHEIDSDAPLPPASTTKLVTALVALDLYSGDKLIIIPEVCTRVEGQKVGFVTGEAINVKDLIYSLLVGSGGDAACALAYGGAVEYGRFIGLMNKKVEDINAQNSHFVNPIGLDDAVASHRSSARDLTLIAKEAVNDSFIEDVVKTKEFDIISGSLKRKIFNTNDLLWDVEGTVGVKTGRTYGAGEVLVYQYKKDGADLIIVVMGSEDRFGDTERALEWSLNSYNFGSAL